MRDSAREPDNELFDRGCDLVEAAGAIRRLAEDPDSARAVPALLGCLEASLEELAAAATALEATASPDGSRFAVSDRMHRGMGNLRVALADAAAAARAARALTARALAARERA